MKCRFVYGISSPLLQILPYKRDPFRRKLASQPVEDGKKIDARPSNKRNSIHLPQKLIN
jgi:hypothetical protein